MKLKELIDLKSDQQVAIESTMNRETMGTTTYSVAEACQTYLQYVERDGNLKSAKDFVKGLVLLE